MTTQTRVGAVFLDRDGVIVSERPHYLTSPADVELLPGAAMAIARLTRAGHRVIVVTNQSAVGRGLLTAQGLAAIHDRISELVGEAGGTIEAFLACTHLPEAGCTCRKPLPGLLTQASRDLRIELQWSFVVGDQRVDIDAACAAACSAVLVLSGQTAVAPDDLAGCDVVADLPAAVELILSRVAVA